MFNTITSSAFTVTDIVMNGIVDIATNYAFINKMTSISNTMVWNSLENNQSVTNTKYAYLIAKSIVSCNLTISVYAITVTNTVTNGDNFSLIDSMS